LGLVIEQEDGSNAPIVTEILYKRIVPAAGVMLFVGNVFYTWQAIRMTRKYKKAYTAQPYGLNTAGGFPFIFGIMYGVFFSYQCTAEDGSCTTEENNARFILAWQVCVAANFTTGLINIFLGFFGRHMMKFFPVAAMLVPLAGIGFTWLALNQIAPNFANPSMQVALV
jgi:AGZA family xanthine/uracil permease-like MFS transporter